MVDYAIYRSRMGSAHFLSISWRNRLSRPAASIPSRAAGTEPHEICPYRPKPDGALVVDGRPLEPRRPRVARRIWPFAEPGGKPIGCRAHRLRRAALRPPPSHHAAAGDGVDVRGLTSAAADDSAHRPHRLRRRRGPAFLDLCDWGRDQGCAPMDKSPGIVGATIRIRKTDLRRAY